MEIVLAVLLLFGSFTLGTIAADNEDEDVESTRVVPNVEGVPGSHPAIQVTQHSDPTRCHSDKSVIYRDLTIPYHGEIERPVIEARDCEGECPDE
ncbi:MAG TPA: hypothetical protein ENJ35_02210 [Gammaproteobacteria bacterium]|nr:hypothetical protein [Gammaproteobacteria bacterium]